MLWLQTIFHNSKFIRLLLFKKAFEWKNYNEYQPSSFHNLVEYFHQISRENCSKFILFPCLLGSTFQSRAFASCFINKHLITKSRFFPARESYESIKGFILQMTFCETGRKVALLVSSRNNFFFVLLFSIIFSLQRQTHGLLIFWNEIFCWISTFNLLFLIGDACLCIAFWSLLLSYLFMFLFFWWLLCIWFFNLIFLIPRVENWNCCSWCVFGDDDEWDVFQTWNDKQINRRKGYNFIKKLLVVPRGCLRKALRTRAEY